MCTEGSELQNTGLHLDLCTRYISQENKSEEVFGAIHAQYTMDARSTREKPSDISNQARSHDCIEIG